MEPGFCLHVQGRLLFAEITVDQVRPRHTCFRWEPFVAAMCETHDVLSRCVVSSHKHLFLSQVAQGKTNQLHRRFISSASAVA